MLTRWLFPFQKMTNEMTTTRSNRPPATVSEKCESLRCVVATSLNPAATRAGNNRFLWGAEQEEGLCCRGPTLLLWHFTPRGTQSYIKLKVFKLANKDYSHEESGALVQTRFHLRKAETFPSRITAQNATERLNISETPFFSLCTSQNAIKCLTCRGSLVSHVTVLLF